MKKLLFLLGFLLLFVTYSLKASETDIYESLLNQNTEKSLDSLYNLLKKKNTVDNFSYIKRFYHSGIQNESEKIVFNAFRLMGRFYRNVNLPDSAKIIYQKAIDYKFEDKKYNIDATELMASIMILLREYNAALDLLIPLIAQTEENSIQRAGVYSLVGNVYRSNNMLDNALEYLHKAYDIEEFNNNIQSMADMSINFIALYAMSGDFENAQKYGDNAIKIYTELGNKERLGDTYMNLAYINYMTQDYYGAIEFYENALKIEKETNNSEEDIVGLLNNIASCYTNLGESKKAIETIENHINLDENNYHNSNLFRILETAHFNLLDEELTNKDVPSAMKAYKKLVYYSNIKDSLFKVENEKIIKQAIADASAKFDTELLENEKSLAIAKKEIAEKRLFYLSIIAFLFILFIIILLVLNNKKNILARELKIRENKLSELNSELFDKIDRLINSVSFKDKLLKVISHDLQSPVQSLKMLSDAIVTDGEKLEKVEILQKSKIFSEISSELSVLLTNLLTWIKANGQSIIVEKTDFNIYELAEDVIKLYSKSASEKKIRIINNINISWVVNADRNMIATVLRNLISNAIKFSDENTLIQLNSEITNNKIKISVKDEGKGIDEEKLDDIFKYNSNISDNDNSGIGLRISKEFVEMNEGEIYVKSMLGVGSEFGFELNKK